MAQPHPTIRFLKEIQRRATRPCVTLPEKPVIGIDLGASHTNVSFRQGWVSGQGYDKPSQLVRVDGGALIPSLVILTKRGGLCGHEAAEYTPLPEDRVYQNWKACIFSESRSEDLEAAMDAAGRFFEWLRGKLETAGLPITKSRAKSAFPLLRALKSPRGFWLGRCTEMVGKMPPCPAWKSHGQKPWASSAKVEIIFGRHLMPLPRIPYFAPFFHRVRKSAISRAQANFRSAL